MPSEAEPKDSNERIIMSGVPSAVEIGEAVIYQKLHDEVVILNMSNQQYYGLDDVASNMWELLVTHKRIDAVVEHLEATYAVDGETLRKDLGGLVQDLMTAGLVKAVG